MTGIGGVRAIGSGMIGGGLRGGAVGRMSGAEDSGGHNYVGGYDANGVSNPESAIVMNGFSQASNRLDDLLAVAILALMTPDKPDANPVVVASIAPAAVQAYPSMQAVG